MTKTEQAKDLLATGMSAKQVAEVLELNIKTVYRARRQAIGPADFNLRVEVAALRSEMEAVKLIMAKLANCTDTRQDS